MKKELESENVKKYKMFSAFQKEPHKRTNSERITVVLSKLVAVSVILFLTLSLIANTLNIINEMSNDVEKRKYESIANETGLNEKEIILTTNLFQPGYYKAETSKGTYTVQFDDEYNIKRIVKDD